MQPKKAWRTYFNPRSHKGSDRLRDLIYRIRIRFQPTLPQRERLVRTGVEAAYHKISTHAPTKGATSGFQGVCWFKRFQPTLPQRERLNLRFKVRNLLFISTHAPTKGATSEGFYGCPAGPISTHAPTKGATNLTHSFLDI